MDLVARFHFVASQTTVALVLLLLLLVVVVAAAAVVVVVLKLLQSLLSKMLPPMHPPVKKKNLLSLWLQVATTTEPHNILIADVVDHGQNPSPHNFHTNQLGTAHNSSENLEMLIQKHDIQCKLNLNESLRYVVRLLEKLQRDFVVVLRYGERDDLLDAV